MYNENKVVTLEITTFSGYAIDSRHFYGSLVGYIGDKFTRMDLKYKLSSRDAKKMNKADHDNSYRAGSISTRFFDRDKLIEQAIATYRMHFPDAIILMEGSSACGDPQVVLNAPDDFKAIVTELLRQAEEVGWYEGNKRKMDEISNVYRRYLEFYLGDEKDE